MTKKNLICMPRILPYENRQRHFNFFWIFQPKPSPQKAGAAAIVEGNTGEPG